MNEEYISLKNEYLSLQEKHNSSNYGIITLVFAILTFSFLLYDQTKALYYEGAVYAKRINVFLVIIRVLSFVLPLIILSIQSVKMERNYKQMISASIYLQVMYEYPSCVREKGLPLWEKSRQVLLRDNGRITKWYEKIFSYLNENIINMEMYITASFVGVLQSVLIIAEMYEIWHKVWDIDFIYCLMLAFIPFCILSVFQFVVRYNTSMKLLGERYIEKTKEIITQIAIDNGIIDFSKKEECLNFIVM